MSQQLKLPRVIASATLVLPTSYFMSHDLTNLVSVVVWSRYDLVACKDLKRKNDYKFGQNFTLCIPRFGNER